VIRNDGKKLAKKVGAHSFIECSVTTGENVKKVFEQAVRAACKLSNRSAQGCSTHVNNQDNNQSLKVCDNRCKNKVKPKIMQIISVLLPICNEKKKLIQRCLRRTKKNNFIGSEIHKSY
jgi:hypothetical protein